MPAEFSKQFHECGRLIISANGGHIPLRGQVIRLGRCARCSHVIVPGPTVSRCHCRILVELDNVCIEDLHSRNGTWLNGIRINRAELANGAVVHLGMEQFVFEVSLRWLRSESSYVVSYR